MSTAFDARCLEHPAFSIFDPSVLARLTASAHFPSPSELRQLAQAARSASELPFEFELEDAERVREAGGFDAFIAQSARIPTRPDSYHDLFGGLIWLHFPRLKRAIHEAQLAQTGGTRSARQNAATHLDESGVLVVSSDRAVFEGLAALEWLETLWSQRAALVETTRFLAFGHGLLDSLRAPHARLMSMALFVRVRPRHLRLTPCELRGFLDRELSQALPDFLLEPRRLSPLPALGVPAWSHAQSAEFYRDERYFRRVRQRLHGAPTAAFIDLVSR